MPRRVVWFVLLIAFSVGRMMGQAAMSVCGVAPVVARDAQPNIFSDEQEQWLGEALADYQERWIKPARDASENAYLQGIADRLVATLPSTGVKFKVVLVDSSVVNGFSTAGGHIYINRKLAAESKSEDELAAVIGHEIGHIASHQFAFEMTASMKRLMGVTSMGDRADVYAKVQRWLDAMIKDKHPKKADEDTEEDEADRIGMYAFAAAGYRPQSMAEFWDRVFFVNGKTGDRLTDFFGLTKPDEKRLRGMRAMAAALPPGCGGSRKVAPEEFAAWHEKVVANQAGDASVIENVGTEVTLLPLHMDLERLRYSRDGKLILAQDESSVFILSREPLEVLFRFDAEGAFSAKFSPDSTKVAFSTPGLHTEEWSVVEKKLIAAHEVAVKDQCYKSSISPDGRTLICVVVDRDGWEVDLHLVDIASGAVVWEKQGFCRSDMVFQPNYFLQMAVTYPDSMPWSYSADGNVLLIGPGSSKLAFDLRTRTPIRVSGDLKGKVTAGYAFLGNDKVIGIDADRQANSGVFSFPDGRQLQRSVVPLSQLEPVASAGSEAMVLGHRGTAMGTELADLTTGKTFDVKSYGLDIWDGVMATEGADGSVALAKLEGSDWKVEQRATLPLSRLSYPQSADMSDDGRYLAFSNRTRGVVWDLVSGNQVFLLHGFTSARWVGDLLYAEFPKSGKQERFVTEISPKSMQSIGRPYPVTADAHMQYGWLREWKQTAKGKWDLVMHDPANNKVLWTRSFSDGLLYTSSVGGHELLFAFPLESTQAKERLKTNSALAAEVAAIKAKGNGELIEVVDGSTGKTLSEVVMDLPPSIGSVDGLNRAGNLLYINGLDNRTMVYSLETGAQVRQMFGLVEAIDPASGRVCLTNRRDEAIVYDTNGKELAHVHTGAALRFAQFSNKGNSLVLLTADQKVQTVPVGQTVVAVTQ